MLMGAWTTSQCQPFLKPASGWLPLDVKTPLDKLVITSLTRRNPQSCGEQTHFLSEFIRRINVITTYFYSF